MKNNKKYKENNEEFIKGWCEHNTKIIRRVIYACDAQTKVEAEKSLENLLPYLGYTDIKSIRNKKISTMNPVVRAFLFDIGSGDFKELVEDLLYEKQLKDTYIEINEYCNPKRIYCGDNVFGGLDNIDPTVHPNHFILAIRNKELLKKITYDGYLGEWLTYIINTGKSYHIFRPDFQYYETLREEYVKEVTSKNKD